VNHIKNITSSLRSFFELKYRATCFSVNFLQIVVKVVRVLSSSKQVFLVPFMQPSLLLMQSNKGNFDAK